MNHSMVGKNTGVLTHGPVTFSGPCFHKGHDFHEKPPAMRESLLGRDGARHKKRASGAAAAVVACVLVAGFVASQQQPREVSLAAGAGSQSMALATTFSGDSVAVPPTYVNYGKGTTFSPQAPFENSAMDKSVRTVSLAARLPQELAEMPATGSLHDDKVAQVAQLFREEAQDAAEAAAAVAANQPSQALKYQKEASKLASKAVSAAANLEAALPTGFHALKPGQKLPKGAILEPFAPRLAKGYHVLKPGMKLPKGAVIVKQAPVRMRAGTLRHGSRKAQAKSEGDKSVLDDARAGVGAIMKRAVSVQHETGADMDAVMNRAASTFKDVQGEAQALLRRAHVSNVFR